MARLTPMLQKKKADGAENVAQVAGTFVRGLPCCAWRNVFVVVFSLSLLSFFALLLQPLPIRGWRVGITVMSRTFAPAGRLTMCSTDAATSSAADLGEGS